MGTAQQKLLQAALNGFTKERDNHGPHRISD